MITKKQVSTCSRTNKRDKNKKKQALIQIKWKIKVSFKQQFKLLAINKLF